MLSDTSETIFNSFVSLMSLIEHKRDSYEKVQRRREKLNYCAYIYKRLCKKPSWNHLIRLSNAEIFWVSVKFDILFADFAIVSKPVYVKVRRNLNMRENGRVKCQKFRDCGEYFSLLRNKLLWKLFDLRSSNKHCQINVCSLKFKLSARNAHTLVQN